MAVVKPLNPTVNYERAWRELRGKIGGIWTEGEKIAIQVDEEMDKLEKKHKNMITLKERSNPEIVDYCIKKTVEARMEVICLRRRLKEQKNRGLENAKRMWEALPERGGLITVPEKAKSERKLRKLFNVHLVTITNGSLEFNLDMKVTAKKFEYYKNAYNKGEDISWHGLKMRIVELNCSYPEGDKKEGMTFRYLRRKE